MKVKGIELFKMIKAGMIKNGTKVRVIYGTCNPVYIFLNNCLYKENKEMGISILLSDHDFEILEDKTEEIEEVDTTTENTLFTMECFIGIPEKAQDWNFNILKDKINELVRAYNSLIKQDTSKETNCMSD